MGRWIDAKWLKSRVHDVLLANGAVHGCIDKLDLIEAPSIDICLCRECKYTEFCEKKIHRHGIAYSIDSCSYGSRSEKPNNSTISKMEQVETMSCAECKHRPIGAEICEEPCHYEPQTDCQW